VKEQRSRWHANTESFTAFQAERLTLRWLDFTSRNITSSL